MNEVLAGILVRYDGNKQAAMRYCIRVAIQFPQLAEEYNGYAKTLASMGEDSGK